MIFFPAHTCIFTSPAPLPRAPSLSDPQREGRGEGGEQGGIHGQREAQGGRRRQEGLQRRRVPEADLGHARGGGSLVGILVEETVGLPGEKERLRSLKLTPPRFVLVNFCLCVWFSFLFFVESINNTTI